MRRFALSVVLVHFSVGLLLAQQSPLRLLEYGFEERVRNEQWNNLFDYYSGQNDERNQIRWRSRLWLKAALTPNVDFFVGLNQETNQIFTPRNAWRFDEIIFESLYLDFRNLWVKGLSLRVGRQNIQKGEGFVVFDGNPLDGSRSIYFNSVVLAYEFKKQRLELIGISNPRMDRYLPRFNDRKKQLIEWDEQAVEAYYTNKERKTTQFESYYFYKKETGDSRPSTNPQFQPDRHISTAGGRVVQQLKGGWSLTGEMALQWGRQHPQTDIAAWGGYGYVKRAFDHKTQPYLLTGYWGMSGDDPSTTNRIEGWDPIFSRWPKWSELYIYSQAREQGAGYWTNTGMWQLEAGCSPWKPVKARATYYHMDSFHPYRAGDPALFGSGTLRGNHVQGRLDVTANEHWRGHLLIEHHSPGSFYLQKSAAWFFRWEVIFNVQGSYPSFKAPSGPD